MITIDDLEMMLNEIADELPKDFQEEIYKKLNGGVIISPYSKIHPESDASLNLYILGEYHYQPLGLGRYIVIYYGSFIRVHAHTPPKQQKEALRDILLHEITHHFESLAGDRSLEKQDAQDIAKYKFRIKRSN